MRLFSGSGTFCPFFFIHPPDRGFFFVFFKNGFLRTKDALRVAESSLLSWTPFGLSSSFLMRPQGDTCGVSFRLLRVLAAPSQPVFYVFYDADFLPFFLLIFTYSPL